MAEIVNVKLVPEDKADVLVRCAVAFGITALSTVLLIWIQRKASEPDFFLTTRMRALNVVARYADGRANHWHKVSEKATKLYLDSRP